MGRGYLYGRINCLIAHNVFLIVVVSVYGKLKSSGTGKVCTTLFPSPVCFFILKRFQLILSREEYLFFFNFFSPVENEFPWTLIYSQNVKSFTLNSRLIGWHTCVPTALKHSKERTSPIVHMLLLGKELCVDGCR